MVHKHFIIWHSDGCRFGHSYYHKANYPAEVKAVINSNKWICYAVLSREKYEVVCSKEALNEDSLTIICREAAIWKKSLLR